MDSSLQNTRMPQILSLLKIHGPLSFRALNRMLVPSIHKHRLRKALARLSSRGAIQRRFERIFGGAGTYYQIAQDEFGLGVAAQILGLCPEELSQPHFKARELIHSETCALWAHGLSRIYPDAKIIRDFDFTQNDAVSKLMITSPNEYEMRPDLLLLLPAKEGQRKMSISVEIERSLKTRGRLVSKLKKYASRSRIDGVIYVTGRKRILDVLQELYKTKVFESALRIKHYGHNFFMFTAASPEFVNETLKLYNTRGEAVYLNHWKQTLGAYEHNFRRDHYFAKGGGRPPPTGCIANASA